jgi:hypothetical protein
MSFKDLGQGITKPQPHQETPEEAEMRAKAAARHRAKEERSAKNGAEKKEAPSSGGAARGDPKNR